MIFFSLPQVGQLKPETLFGEHDHYGFIQTIVGKEYIRSNIQRDAIDYYLNKKEKYWDQIISLINFFALRKLDENNIINEIPLLDYISEKFDIGDYTSSNILFDYLLATWQYPHPIVTKNIPFRAYNLEIFNPRNELPIIKPYAIILLLLKKLKEIGDDNSYLTENEFYWFSFNYYSTRGKNYNKKNIDSLVQELLEVRQNGIKKEFKSITNEKKTHLSYPKGFLRNSSVLDIEKMIFNKKDKVFIKIKDEYNLNFNVINNLIDYSFENYFEFDPSRKSESLEFDYANFLYDIESINRFLKQVNIYSSTDNIHSDKNQKNKKLNEGEFYKKKYERQLKRISTLDRKSQNFRRTEQYILRNYIKSGNEEKICAICNQSFHPTFLTTAHIKKRSKCSDLEKKDLYNILPICNFGCDKIFELGYVFVEDGILKINNEIPEYELSNYINEYLKRINLQKCSYWNEKNQKYFLFHQKNNFKN